MAKQMGFTVSKKGFPEFSVTALLPENKDDERWGEICSDGDGIHDLALRSWIVQVQANARGRLDDSLSEEENQAAVQAAVDGYVYGARSGGFSRPTISTEKQEALAFTPEQLASLRALGVNVEAAAA